MSREELTEASELLREAGERAEGTLADRIDATADQLERLAGTARGPDQGRLARIENTFRELEADADDATEGTVRTAHEKVQSYRETVSGI